MRWPAAFLIPSPLVSEKYCQNIIPAYHLISVYAFEVAYPNLSKSIHPEFMASLGVTGFPITNLFDGTPLFIIYCTDVPLKYPLDFVNNYSYVSYFVSPWL